MDRNEKGGVIKNTTLDLRKIHVAERVRIRLEGIEPLAETIAQVGLLNPLSVFKLKEPIDGRTHQLLAGRRRLAALQFLAEAARIPWIVSVRVFPDNNPLTMILIESIENIQRVSFTPYETVRTYAETHEVLIKTYGKALPGVGGVGQKLSDTAKMLGTSVPQLSKDLKLWEQIQKFPQEIRITLQDAPTRADLERLVNGIVQRTQTQAMAKVAEAGIDLGTVFKGTKELEKLERMAEKVGETTEQMALNAAEKSGISVTSDKKEAPVNNLSAEESRKNKVLRISEAYRVYPATGDILTQGAFRFLYEDLPASCADFIEIDPPYGIDLVNIKKSETSNELMDGYVEVPEDQYAMFLDKLVIGVGRVLRFDRWGIIWFSEAHQKLVYDAFTSRGFSVAAVPGLWIKPTGQTNNPKHILGNSYESFYYFRKGSPVLAKMGRGNVFNYQTVPPQNKIHPAERPKELIKELLQTFVGPSSERKHIVVPFCGSGRTLIEAMRMGFSAIGCDLNKDYRSRYIVAATTELT